MGAPEFQVSSISRFHPPGGSCSDNQVLLALSSLALLCITPLTYPTCSAALHLESTHHFAITPLNQFNSRNECSTMQPRIMPLEKCIMCR